MAWREGRLAKRVVLKIRVFLESPEGAKPKEATCTENVSPRGLRVYTKYLWQPREELLVTVAKSGIRRRGRVVYCVPVEGGWFRAGISWDGMPIDWAHVDPEAVAS
jgi:hypothetical protein